jgi:hypothetical protein
MKKHIANKQLYFAFQLHFSVTIATQVSPCYSRGASSYALIRDATWGNWGLVYTSHDSSEDGFASGCGNLAWALLTFSYFYFYTRLI